MADGPLTWEWRSFVKLRYPGRGWRSWAGHTVQAPPAGVHVYTSPLVSVAECHVRRGRLACEEASTASVAYDRRAV